MDSFMNGTIGNNQETPGMTFSHSQPRMNRLSEFVGHVIDTDLTDIGLLLHAPVEIGLRQIIVDTLILLAVVEVFKTTLTYFSEGRVKVTFIVDTILVVMLTEIISLWFKDADHMKLLSLGAILLALGAIRVVAVRCSPAQGDGTGRGSFCGREEI